MIHNGIEVILRNKKYKQRTEVGMPTNLSGSKLSKSISAGYIPKAYFAPPEKIILKK